MKLDTKVLEAAWAMYLSGDRGRKGFCQAVRTAFDTAELEPRSEVKYARVKLWKVLDERDEARSQCAEALALANSEGKQIAALREALEDMLENFGVPYDGCLSVETARAALTDTAPEKSE